MTKPTADDIKQAIATSGRWLRLTDDGWMCWSCTLYDPDGNVVVDDQDDDICALTPGLAMAQAWVRYWAPTPPILPGAVPLEVPDGWTFELSPPLTDDALERLGRDVHEALERLGFDAREADPRADREEHERLQELRGEFGPKH